MKVKSRAQRDINCRMTKWWVLSSQYPRTICSGVTCKTLTKGLKTNPNSNVILLLNYYFPLAVLCIFNLQLEHLSLTSLPRCKTLGHQFQGICQPVLQVNNMFRMVCPINNTIIFILQSNPVNTDTDGTMDSVHINRVSLLSGFSIN